MSHEISSVCCAKQCCERYQSGITTRLHGIARFATRLCCLPLRYSCSFLDPPACNVHPSLSRCSIIRPSIWPEPESIACSPAPYRACCYLCTYAAAPLRGMRQISANGGLVWSIYVGSVVSSPAVGEDGTIYFGSGDRNVWAVTDGGMTRWRYTTPMPVVASAHCTSDAVYIGDRNGTMYKVRV